MATGTLQHRRGSSATIVAATPAVGEIFLDTDTLKPVFGDGVSAGGVHVDGARRNAQTGTSYSVLNTDVGKLVTFSNASPVAVTLSQAGSSSGAYFAAQSKINALNIGAGTVTITPTTSTINGLSTLTLQQYEGALIWSDGTNYFAIKGSVSAANTPGGTNGAIQYNSSGSFGGAVITGLVKGNGTSAPSAAAAGTDYAAATSGSANTPLFNNGSGGFTNGTRTGNSTLVATSTGSQTNGNLVSIDANGNHIASGIAASGIAARNNGKLLAQWVSGAIVANTTVYMAYKVPYNGTVDSLDYFTGNGSFVVAIKINGTNVTGLSAVTVNSSTPANTSASGANTFIAGDTVTAVISSSTSSPTDAVLNLNVTWT